MITNAEEKERDRQAYYYISSVLNFLLTASSNGRRALVKTMTMATSYYLISGRGASGNLSITSSYSFYNLTAETKAAAPRLVRLHICNWLSYRSISWPPVCLFDPKISLPQILFYYCWYLSNLVAAARQSLRPPPRYFRQFILHAPETTNALLMLSFRRSQEQTLLLACLLLLKR